MLKNILDSHGLEDWASGRNACIQDVGSSKWFTALSNLKETVEDLTL